jgi:hypothetical protein
LANDLETHGRVDVMAERLQKLIVDVRVAT